MLKRINNESAKLQVQLTCQLRDDESDLVQSFGVRTRSIRDLIAEELESLVMVNAIVVQARTKRHKVKRMQVFARICQNSFFRWLSNEQMEKIRMSFPAVAVSHSSGKDKSSQTKNIILKPLSL